MKKNQPDFIEAAAGRSTVLPIVDSAAGLDFLVSLFAVIRPGRGQRNAAILEFMSQSVGFLAYQIAEHKGAKGC
jgi:hypothetical protein